MGIIYVKHKAKVLRASRFTSWLCRTVFLPLDLPARSRLTRSLYILLTSVIFKSLLQESFAHKKPQWNKLTEVSFKMVDCGEKALWAVVGIFYFILFFCCTTTSSHWVNRNKAEGLSVGASIKYSVKELFNSVVGFHMKFCDPLSSLIHRWKDFRSSSFLSSDLIRGCEFFFDQSIWLFFLDLQQMCLFKQPSDGASVWTRPDLFMLQIILLLVVAKVPVDGPLTNLPLQEAMGMLSR